MEVEFVVCVKNGTDDEELIIDARLGLSLGWKNIREFSRDGTTEGNLVGFLELRRVGRHVG